MSGMSRRILMTGILGFSLFGVGCGIKSYQNVEAGAQGPTSPRESGEQGPRADQTPPYGDAAKAAEEHKIAPYREAYTNGFTDPSMEGSGNLANQGNYPLSKQQQNPAWDGNTAR